MTAEAALTPTTAAGRGLHSRYHKGECPREYGEDCWYADDLEAIERAAAAAAVEQIRAVYLDRNIDQREAADKMGTIAGAALAASSPPAPEAGLDSLAVQEADMCPNCVTPWKCNGPHLSPGLTPAPADPTDE